MERVSCTMGTVGAALMISGLLVAASRAGEWDDAKCVTMLSPATCRAAANSYCNATAAAGNCESGQCTTCDASTALPDKACVSWEGESCSYSGDTIECDPSSSLLIGDCAINGSCVCANVQRQGTCGGMGTWQCN